MPSCCCRARWRGSSSPTRRATCCAPTASSPPIRRASPTARSRGCPAPLRDRDRPAHGAAPAARAEGRPARGRDLPSRPVAAGARAAGRAPATPSSGTGAGTATRWPTTPRRRCACGSRRCTSRPRERSALTFVVSGKLAELEREAGREAQLVGLAADSFPAPDPGSAVIAVSLGHLGWRTDWALLRAVAEQMPELVLLLVGAWHEDECKDDADFAWCRTAPNLVWLGPAQRRGGGAADPLRRRRDPAVPRRALQRRGAALPDPQVRPPRAADDLAGAGRRAHVGSRGDDGAPTPEAFVAALRAQAGARLRPDARAARMGARADRRAGQRAAVGAAAGARPGLNVVR